MRPYSQLFPAVLQGQLSFNGLVSSDFAVHHLLLYWNSSSQLVFVRLIAEQLESYKDEIAATASVKKQMVDGEVIAHTEGVIPTRQQDQSCFATMLLCNCNVASVCQCQASSSLCIVVAIH